MITPEDVADQLNAYGFNRDKWLKIIVPIVAQSGGFTEIELEELLTDAQIIDYQNQLKGLRYEGR
jgi:hypothetical protein